MQVIGAQLKGTKCEFVMWGPLLDQLDVHIVSNPERIVPMKKDDRGYWRVTIDDVSAGTQYYYRINQETDRPDPASYFQPEDVAGPCAVVDHGAYTWNDAGWQGIEFDEMIIYELHVATFTSEGTFDAVIGKLDYLEKLGINTVEIMPVSQFPGSRNWGYDGVFPYAVQHSYGGPDGLKRLVDACHKRNMAVILDVVYNHLGPEGNYLQEFMPCFTDVYQTPWGKAINYDEAYCVGVRNFFIQNALYWFDHFHIDALRLDAIHGIYDFGAKHFLKELSENVRDLQIRLPRSIYLIAESDLNDTKIIAPYDHGGYGIDAQWNDDFHHCVHTLLTGEDKGYYKDFCSLGQLAKSIREGFVYSWDYSPHRKRYHGSSSKNVPAHQFVVCCQNHDQVGNRMLGQRLSSLVSFEGAKLAGATLLLSPYIPLLFMGEEYAEKAPFLYFMSFYDDNLIEAVRKGRKQEFSSFNWEGDPPDPYAQETFDTSRLNWSLIGNGNHAAMLSLYKRLIGMRKEHPALRHLSKQTLSVESDETTRLVVMQRWHNERYIVVLLNFNTQAVSCTFNHMDASWNQLIDTSAQEWNGPGTQASGRIDATCEVMLNPLSAIVYERV